MWRCGCVLVSWLKSVTQANNTMLCDECLSKHVVHCSHSIPPLNAKVQTCCITCMNNGDSDATFASLLFTNILAVSASDVTQWENSKLCREVRSFFFFFFLFILQMSAGTDTHLLQSFGSGWCTEASLKFLFYDFSSQNWVELGAISRKTLHIRRLLWHTQKAEHFS